VSRSFCGGCGTPLTYEGARWPGEVHVLVGSLDRPEAVTPTGEAFAEERLPWLHLASTAPAPSGMPRTLQTGRLVLRPFCESDLDVLARLYADERFMRYIGPVAGRDDSWRHLAQMLGHWELRGYGLWAVEHQGRLVGRIGLYRPEGWPDLEVGWALAPALWGRGFAIEGARAALDQAALVLGRPDPVSVIHPDNAASIRVAERLGARLERRIMLRGEDVLIYRHRHCVEARPGA
jgi:RimJ/RimL family protein N-acetyltransferase